MLYFIKQNHKLNEYRDHFKNLENLCSFLDKLNPELEKAKILLKKKSNSRNSICLGDYLEQQHSFQYSEFKNIDLTIRNSFSALKSHVVHFKKILDTLKNYESFQGRIKFDQFADLFNFEDFIYEDKQFKYSIISTYNKRIIPEFVSAAFANLIYENHVSEEIRRCMEQYFIAIMSNMDYQNFSHISQLKSEMKNSIEKNDNIIYILGAVPQTFNSQEYVDVLNERIEKADELIKSGIVSVSSKTKIWLKSKIEKEFYKKINDSINFESSWEEAVLGKENNGKRPVTKLTVENLKYIFNDIHQRQQDGMSTNYNLFIITSTFHVLKTAIEVEKHFYNEMNNRPNNIVFVGNEKFFELAHSRSNCADPDRSIFHKKKLKSFLYELFLHTLDRNAVNL